MRSIFSKNDQIGIIRDKNFCPRCRQVAAMEFTNERLERDSSNPDVAVEAYKIEDEMKKSGKAQHLFTSGKCHAPKDWLF